jgi:hypothetical protein
MGAQVLCAEMYNKALGEGTSLEEVQKMLINILADGVNYGNWPWTEEAVLSAIHSE